MDQILRTRNSSYRSEHDAVFALCDTEILSLHLHDVDVPTDDAGLEEWTRAHKVPGVTDPGASDAHLTTKLTGVYWLDTAGHTMSTTNVETPEGVPAYHYASECFDQSVGSHRADTVCCCDEHTVVVEAGYTPPSRLLRAFGFRYYENISVDTNCEVDGVTRIDDTVFESFCVAPYRFGGMAERPVFEFRAKNLRLSSVVVSIVPVQCVVAWTSYSTY